MPAYNTQPMPTPKPALYTGDQIALVNNAAVDAGILATEQVAIAPAPGDTATYCTVFNGTNQAVQMQAAPSDSGGGLPQGHHPTQAGDGRSDALGAA